MSEIASRPPAPITVSPLQRLAGDFAGGLSAAVVGLPTAISCGLLAFGPLGSEYVSVGVAAGLYAGIFVTVVAAVFGGSRFQISGPRSSLAIALGALAGGLMANPVVAGEGPTKAATVMTLVLLCGFLAGVIQILLGALRLGTLVKFIPHSVIAGLMNGFAIIIIIQQLPIFLGVPASVGFSGIAIGKATVEFSAVMVGVVAIGAMIAANRLLKHTFGSLVGLLVGTATYHIILPAGASATFAGGVIGDIPTHLPTPGSFMDMLSLLASPAAMGGTIPALLGSAVTIALLGSVLSLLSAVHADAISRTCHLSNRELIGQGLANMASAAFGGLPGSGSAARVTVNFAAGGRTRVASIVHGLFFLLAVTAFGPFVGHIPVVTVAALLLVFAVQMFDMTTMRLIGKACRPASAGIGREAATDLAVVLIVTGTTVFVGFVTATGVGLVVASLLFAARLSRTVIRGRLQGDHVRSKTVRSHAAAEFLDRHGQAIVVFELQGAIFFGSADQLARTIRESLQGVDAVILDLRLATDLDSTGLTILRQLDELILAQGKMLLIAGLSPDRPLSDTIQNLAGNDPVFGNRTYPDADAALTAAEDRLLAARADVREQTERLELSEIDALQGMAEDQLRYLAQLMVPKTFVAGECIVAQGERGEAMYFLSTGTVSIRLQIANSIRTTRLVSFKPGVVFGEMALLSDKPRSASVFADEASTCYVLSRAAFDSLRTGRPDILAALILNISRELANRLRVTSEQISHLEK